MGEVVTGRQRVEGRVTAWWLQCWCRSAVRLEAVKKVRHGMVVALVGEVWWTMDAGLLLKKMEGQALLVRVKVRVFAADEAGRPSERLFI